MCWEGASAGAGISGSVSPMGWEGAFAGTERRRSKARSTSSFPGSAASGAGEGIPFASGSAGREEAGKGIRFPTGNGEPGLSPAESRTAEPRSKKPSPPGAGGAGAGAEASSLRTTMLSPHFRHFTRAPLPLILDSSRRNRAWHVWHSMIIPGLRKMLLRDVALLPEL